MSRSLKTVMALVAIALFIAINSIISLAVIHHYGLEPESNHSSVSSNSSHVRKVGAIPAGFGTFTINGNGQSGQVTTFPSALVSVNITGTWVGTIGFQASYDGGATWSNVSLSSVGSSGAAVSSTTSNGTWRGGTSGAGTFQVVSTAWTSGTATIYINPSPGTLTLSQGLLSAGSSGTTLNPTLTGRLDGSSNLQQDQCNQQIQVISAATYSGSQNSADFTNISHRGLIIWFNITSAGSTNLTLQVQGKDISGTYFNYLSAPPTRTSSASYLIYPGATSSSASFTVVLSAPLANKWRVTITAGDSSNWTYSVGANLLQ